MLLSLVIIDYVGQALLGSSPGHRHDRVADLSLAEVRRCGQRPLAGALGRGENYDQLVRLFTPVSCEDASRLERGVTLNGPLYRIDRPVSEEAEEDAIWVVLAVPDEEVTAFEQSWNPLQGYREFELPPELLARFPVNRVAND